jgi:23S rRNA (pseudouridine1915-N3)-methyltransferase
MLKVKILSIGKTKEEWLDLAIKEYMKRLQPVVLFEFCLFKNNIQLIAATEKEKMFIGLDPAGIPMDSESFSDFLIQALEENGSRLTFIIGGPEGLPQILKEQGNLVSLSPLTFTHQLTRLILIEQIYRTMEIRKGSHYHKG